MNLSYDKLRIDGGTQTRAAINDDVVNEYAELMKQGVEFPPLTAFYDGENYWLADGFHRLKATMTNHIFSFECDVIQGSRRDAILHSVGANSEHGLRRTYADKHRAVMTMLNNDEVCLNKETGTPWSNVEIAKYCRVSESYVRKLKSQTSHKTKFEQNSAYTHYKTGKPTSMNTANIGKSHSRLKISVPIRGHSNPVPVITVSLPPGNPQAAAAAIKGLFDLSFIKTFVEELTNYLNSQGK